MSWSKESKWIWIDQEAEADTYGDFRTDFPYESGEVILKISADSNYTVWVNGHFADSGQYPDFPTYKVYDKLDITQYCHRGTNQLAIQVWYYGTKGFFTYYAGKAALRFEVSDGTKLYSYSDENVLSRLSKTYENGLKKQITGQIGYSFRYDATSEDSWRSELPDNFSKSRIVQQTMDLFERPVKKVEIAKQIEAKLIKHEVNYHLYDLGREEVGYLTLRVASKNTQKLTICWGEHIADGKVRSKIEGRDFSVEVIVRVGATEYTNYFRRFGLRYLEIWSEDEVTIEYATVLPCSYPVNKVNKKFKHKLHQQIYDVAVRTLELCMHDHYEDCPWREQALYAMDSRNQMLCGYYAFEEFQFARENLYLISKDNREDHLLSICTPCDNELTIPSFSLHYFTSVYEYTKYSGDTTLAEEILPKLQSIMDVFLNRMQDGLVPIFEDRCYWNFYEWREDLQNRILVVNEPDLESALNCLLSLALTNLQKICDLLHVEAQYGEMAEAINARIHQAFYRKETGLFVNRYGEEKYSELVNSLAILCGAASGKEAEQICKTLVSEHAMTKTSLSMMCFKYDALLRTDKEKYKNYVVKDIEDTYQVMLEAGATSFWETERGEVDFAKAGSLCHGWSAMPVYYLTALVEE